MKLILPGASIERESKVIKMDAKSAIKFQSMKEYTRKDFGDITVKSLCAATPVARTTFYS